MITYLRDLLLGLLAWWCGNGAIRLFPVTPLHPDRLGDWVAFLLFKPVELVMAAILFVLGSVLLGGLIRTHAAEAIRRGVFGEGCLNALLCVYAGFLGYIQYLKMPMPTLIFGGAAILILLVRMQRRRSLQTEIIELMKSTQKQFLSTAFPGKRRI
ncbi:MULTISPECIES: hypothetical protein [Brevibacillus]|jgi:cation transport ATPase|uniref:hypothetical protein n=1 Tax=Brevibacillus TaxID=55080 RepID=UPI00149218D7|nr:MULTISPECIES: hypothetical protein [Brevibacillus]MBR8658593.1 hypothetical protein [Brevibacillus sp. NL20B1]MDT3415337.1 cation transport ATPase [Brevibacillus aydinogluensis]NNV02649.1 hypothetical protein [Brevibacillus sp. MCWH]